MYLVFKVVTVFVLLRAAFNVRARAVLAQECGRPWLSNEDYVLRNFGALVLFFAGLAVLFFC